MEIRKRARRRISTFILLTFAISSVFYYLMISTRSARDVALGWMWSPGIAAILTQVLFRGKLGDFGWRLGEAKYLFVGYLIPLVYALVIYVPVWATGLGGFQPQSPLRLLAYAVVGSILACATALGEEIGWRGLLVPQLARVGSFTRTALVSGVIWAIWHYPAILFADYNSGASLWFALPMFTVSVVGLSFPVAWLRLKTGSLWPSVLLHASHNLFIQQVFLSLTVKGGAAAYIVDDFGIGFALSALVLAYVFWRKRSELPTHHLEETTRASVLSGEESEGRA